MKRLTCMLIALILSANAWALPPEIELDRLLFQAKAALDTSDYALATESLMKAEKLSVKLPDTFYYHYGRASFGSGKFEQARDLLEKYLTLSGTKGKFYQEALVELNNIEAAIKKREADRVAEIEKREADRVAAEAKDAKDAKEAQAMWRDPKTNLVWMRCSLGRTWDGNTCTGKAIEYTWHDALDAAKAFNSNGGFGGYTDWVVPHIEDLFTLRYCSSGCSSGSFDKEIIPSKAGGTKTVCNRCNENGLIPTINLTIFPNTQVSYYWSSSPVTDDRYKAWMVGFNTGNALSYSKGDLEYVRLVRSSQ